jgi:hypothetical protein
MITDTYDKMRAALKVVTLDPELHSLLRERDPKALEQLEDAQQEGDRMAPAVRECQDLLEAMLKHRSEAKRIDEMIEKLNYE